MKVLDKGAWQDMDDDEGFDGAPSLMQDLARSVLLAALPPALRRSLDRGESVALLVRVPGPDWVAGVANTFEALWPGCASMPRDGTSKAEHKPEKGNGIVSMMLGEGRAVAGVSHDPKRYLPATLVACADAHVQVGRPDGRTLRHLLRQHALAPVPRHVPDGVCATLSIDEIAASFRARTSARGVLAHLERARDAKSRAVPTDDTPPLSLLPGYSGEPRAFANDLVAGYEAWRRGDLPWSRVPSAAVLEGPPGTGKTTLAKSIARSLGVPLHATSVGAWFTVGEGHLGDVCRQAQQAFDTARQSPSVLYLDELDAIPSRENLSDRAREWWTPLVTLVLTLTDGAATDLSGICLLGATNAGRDRLDPALIRPGRFDRVIHVGLPTADDLAAILRFHLGSDLPDADLAGFCRMVPAASAADAARWIVEARNAARAAGRDLVVADVVEKGMPPERRPRSLLARIARHEAAHAVIGDALGVQKLDSVSLYARGAAGVAHFDKPVKPLTRDVVEALVVTALAGRAADCLWGGGPDAASAGGPGSDTYLATRLLAAARVSWALGDGAPICIGTAEDAHALLARDASLRTAVEADLRTQDARARALVADHGIEIGLVAQALLRERWLSGERVRSIVGKARRVDAMRLGRGNRR